MAGRLAVPRNWDGYAPRVRRSLRRPWWALGWSVALIVLGLVCGALGVTNGWFLALGMLFAVLPARLEAVRERKQALRAANEGELFAIHARELKQRSAGHFVRALLHAGLALLFAIPAVFAARPAAARVVVALLLLSVVVHLFWGLPRAIREERALGLLEDDDDDSDAGREGGPRT